jgi:plasmid maintenance system antidote protein VapI
MNKTHMGNTLKDFLKSRRIKNSECAEFLEMSRPTFRKIIDSEIISYTIICKLQKFLNYDFNFYSNNEFNNPNNEFKMTVKAYTIALLEKDGITTLNIQNSGFNSFELLGILEKSKKDILKNLEKNELEEKLKINIL